MEVGGKVVLITGGSRGIGAATARAFAQAGARVAIVARSEADIHEVAQEIHGLGVVGDIRDPVDCKRIVKEVLEHYSHIDILINNAGVALNKPLVQHSEQDFDEIMETNVKGVFLMTKEVLPHHPKMIVTISSGAGRTGLPGLAIYCASKFAVRGMMEAVSQETHAKVYTVLPGSVDTRMYQELFEKKARIKPEQVADAIVTLCQQEPETGFELELYRQL